MNQSLHKFKKLNWTHQWCTGNWQRLALSTLWGWVHKNNRTTSNTKSL